MGHGPVKIDPAIERFNNMRESAYLNFRWTNCTVRTAVLGFIVVPAAVFYLADRYNQRFNFTATRKGQSLYVGAPSPRVEE
ncbi:hypothetical protein NLJ89_g7717 [Agrocybe chaxingu]|uniref:NADH-ubiquinone oxidoreductase B15 subunit n=1 Tax=Agrocybe chaxingu TaxID=84603 RepID=A0A9W8MSU6_9AGAR|nr:hypothetical protein NLJ89_g7717 [Agrocybe chaxingu]